MKGIRKDRADLETGEESAESREGMEYRGEGETSLFFHQIMDSAPGHAPPQPFFSRNSPTRPLSIIPLHFIVVVRPGMYRGIIKAN